MHYQQDASSIKPMAAKFSFGKEFQRPVLTKVAASIPGPGAYAIKQLVGNESVGKSLGGKLSPAFERPGANKVPGPGAYSAEFRAMYKSMPSWRIGTSTRDDQEKIKRRTCNFPPPDCYSPDYMSQKQAVPKWGFGSG